MSMAAIRLSGCSRGRAKDRPAKIWWGEAPERPVDGRKGRRLWRLIHAQDRVARRAVGPADLDQPPLVPAVSIVLS
jgi:hypothetical protein